MNKYLTKLNTIIAGMAGMAYLVEANAEYVRFMVLPASDMSSTLGRHESATIKAEQLTETHGIEISVAM